jgi:hypothetical protein
LYLAIWDCDFDKSKSDCVPSIHFVRLDDPNSKLSSGFNFRSIEYMHDPLDSRQLTKHYGVRLLVLISGVGRQFDIAALFTAIGAGIGLLSVATLVADFIATNVLHNKNVYRQAKFKEVEVTEEEAQAKAAQDEYEKHVAQTDVINGDGLKAPLRGNGHSYTSDALPTPMDRKHRGSEGVLHISPSNRHPYGRSYDDEDEVEAPWAKAHFPAR